MRQMAPTVNEGERPDDPPPREGRQATEEQEQRRCRPCDTRSRLVWRARPPDPDPLDAQRGGPLAAPNSSTWRRPPASAGPWSSATRLAAEGVRHGGAASRQTSSAAQVVPARGRGRQSTNPSSVPSATAHRSSAAPRLGTGASPAVGPAGPRCPTSASPATVTPDGRRARPSTARPRPAAVKRRPWGRSTTSAAAARLGPRRTGCRRTTGCPARRSCCRRAGRDHHDPGRGRGRRTPRTGRRRLGRPSTAQGRRVGGQVAAVLAWRGSRHGNPQSSARRGPHGLRLVKELGASSERATAAGLPAGRPASPLGPTGRLVGDGVDVAVCRGHRHRRVRVRA